MMIKGEGKKSSIVPMATPMRAKTGRASSNAWRMTLNSLLSTRPRVLDHAD